MSSRREMPAFGRRATLHERRMIVPGLLGRLESVLNPDETNVHRHADSEIDAGHTLWSVASTPASSGVVLMHPSFDLNSSFEPIRLLPTIEDIFGALDDELLHDAPPDRTDDDILHGVSNNPDLDETISARSSPTVHQTIDDDKQKTSHEIPPREIFKWMQEATSNITTNLLTTTELHNSIKWSLHSKKPVRDSPDGFGTSPSLSSHITAPSPQARKKNPHKASRTIQLSLTEDTNSGSCVGFQKVTAVKTPSTYSHLSPTDGSTSSAASDSARRTT